METESPFKLASCPTDMIECPNIQEFVDGIQTVGLLAALYDALMIKPIDVAHILLAGQTLTICDHGCSYTIRSLQSLRHMRDYVRASLIRVGVAESGTSDLGVLLSCASGSIHHESLRITPEEHESSCSTLVLTEPPKTAPTLSVNGSERFSSTGSAHSVRSEFHVLDHQYDTLLVLDLATVDAAKTLRNALSAHIDYLEESHEHQG